MYPTKDHHVVVVWGFKLRVIHPGGQTRFRTFWTSS